MSDVFDHDGLGPDGLDHDSPQGERSPGGPPSSGSRPFRSREELEAENERLREGLLRSREENELLAELLAGQCEEGSGEVVGGVGESEDLAETGQRFVISDAAIDLFEALPEAFSLDEALDFAERLGQRSDDAASHLRAYLGEGMIAQEGERFSKTGRKPYF
jgi:hypothetical protein